MPIVMKDVFSLINSASIDLMSSGCGKLVYAIECRLRKVVVPFVVCLLNFLKVIRVIRSAKNHRLELSSVCTTDASRAVSGLCQSNV